MNLFFNNIYLRLAKSAARLLGHFSVKYSKLFAVYKLWVENVSVAMFFFSLFRLVCFFLFDYRVEFIYCFLALTLGVYMVFVFGVRVLVLRFLRSFFCDGLGIWKFKPLFSCFGTYSFSGSFSYSLIISAFYFFFVVLAYFYLVETLLFLFFFYCFIGVLLFCNCFLAFYCVLVCFNFMRLLFFLSDADSTFSEIKAKFSIPLENASKGLFVLAFGSYGYFALGYFFLRAQVRDWWGEQFVLDMGVAVRLNQISSGMGPSFLAWLAALMYVQSQLPFVPSLLVYRTVGKFNGLVFFFAFLLFIIFISYCLFGVF